MRSKNMCVVAVARTVPMLVLVMGGQACRLLPSSSAGPSLAATTSALTDGPGYNGLPARSLLFNAITQNPEALRTLKANPLSDALFDAQKQPYMNLQLADSNARDVMTDIVSCALDPSAQVRYRVAYDGPAAHAEGTWRGEMGLCPRWSKEKPSEECLRLVSSCLFARTNRLHRRVPGRFEVPGILRPHDRVRVTTTYSKEDAGMPLSEHPVIEAVRRGWKPEYVGSCAPNQPLTLSIPEPSRCRESSIRVCSGIYGCDENSAKMLGEKHRPCDDAPLTFTCPDSGFFGVMTAPAQAKVVSRGPGTGSYPAAEKEVFPFLEGAFFGNLFDSEGLTRHREMKLQNGHPTLTGDADEGTIPHRNIYACYSLDDDEQGVAYLDARICAKPQATKKCFPNPPRRCHFKDAKMNQGKGDHCKWYTGDGLYRECVGDDGVTYPAMTVYLNEPCGLSDAGCASPPPTAN